MGFLEDRRERSRQKRQVDQAIKEYHRRNRDAGALAHRLETEITRRIDEADAAQLPVPFFGLARWSIAAGGIWLSTFKGECGPAPEYVEREEPPPSIALFHDALDEFSTWERALGVTTWACVAAYGALKTTHDDYDVLMDMGTEALGDPTRLEAEVILHGREYSADDDDDGTAFFGRTFECTYEQAMNSPPPPPEKAATYVAPRWGKAADQAIDMLFEKIGVP